jgi:diguanylate cyclase (GGDEF)-like protein
MFRSRPAVFYGFTIIGLALLFALGFMGYYEFVLKSRADAAAWAAQAGLAVAGGGLVLLAVQALLVFRAFISPLARDEERLEELDEAVRRLAVTDELTRVYNRAKLEECLLREMEHVRRYKAKAAALMLDVDGLGAVNREHGDRAGDRLLQGLAGLLRRRVRKNDMVFRWRGDTFVILAPYIDGEQAARFAAKVRREVADAEFDEGLRITVSVSSGEISGDDAPDAFLTRLKDGLSGGPVAGAGAAGISGNPGLSAA